MDGNLLTQLLVYLTAAVVAAPIAKRLGLGSVLGYLIAGVVIGPQVLNLIGAPEDVMHVAEFGVIILLFLIGLEVQPSLLWRLRGAIFGLGSAQLLGSAAVLAAAGLLLGLDWRVALAAGLILAMSSTAIGLAALEERGLREGRVGQGAFSVLLFQDLAVIPLFALLPLLAAAGVGGGEAAGTAHHAGVLDGRPGWQQALAVLAAVAVVVGGGRYLTRPLFRFIAKARLREIFTAAALLLVVAVTALMELVGLSPALGAFLAGVVLADSEYRRELETDIEPFRGLLLGLFFISVGAGVDLALAASQPLVVIGLAAGLLLVKAAVMFAAARVFGGGRREALILAAGLCQGGEFAFVLLGLVVGEGVMPVETARLLTVVVALSMAVTPLLLGLAARSTLFVPAGLPEPEVEPFHEGAPVAVVAGYGRFGQVVTRLLNANKLSTVVLDSSVEQIELVRRFGREAHYGDATRLDLLRDAGIEKAKLLVVAIDDRDQATRLTEAAREAWPDLTILTRAYDRRHAYDLLRSGATEVERETFEAGLAMGMRALRHLGWPMEKAKQAAAIFRAHDLKQFKKLAPLWGEEERYVLAVRDSQQTMERLLAAELADLRRGGPGQLAEAREAADDSEEAAAINARLASPEGRETERA